MSHFEWEDMDVNAGNLVYGVISNIDYENLTADVEGVGTNIPIHYHCEEDAIEDSGKSYDVDYPNEQDERGASAFSEDDDVLVMFRRINNEDPVIVGFPDEAKACFVEGLFSIVYEHNGINQYLIYDPISKNVKLESEDGQTDNYYAAPAYKLVEDDQDYYSDNNIIIASFYDWNDAIWIYRNDLKWGSDPTVFQDHVLHSQFQVLSYPGKSSSDFRISKEQSAIILDRSTEQDGFYIGVFYLAAYLSSVYRTGEWGKYSIWRWSQSYSPYWVGWREYDDLLENWMTQKWDTKNFSFGDLTQGGGTGGAHLPPRTWAQHAYPIDSAITLYDFNYNSVTGEYNYGPYFDVINANMSIDGFANSEVIQGTYPGTEPYDFVNDPLTVPLDSQVWYGCCKSISGIINCTTDSACGYPGGPLHCSGSYCPSYTCYYPYEENLNWGYDWESKITVYGIDSNIGDSKNCDGKWSATAWSRVRFTSAPWLCNGTASVGDPLRDDFLKESTCNQLYTHSKSIFFDANLPIYLVVDNSDGYGTKVWDDPTNTYSYTSGESLDDYYHSLEGIRSATLYIKDGNGTIVNYPCEVNIEDYVGLGYGYGTLGGKIFVAWGSSGETLNDERNDHTLIFYDILPEKRFISDGVDVTTKILAMISDLEFMEGGDADINNVKFVSTRFNPKIALLHGY